jgi:replicative DNA helicase
MVSVKVADMVNTDDFYDVKNRSIYKAITDLYSENSAIDVLTIADKITSTGNLESIGGASYLTELTNYVPTASHIEQYAEIVAQKSLRRKLMAVSKKWLI